MKRTILITAAMAVGLFLNSCKKDKSTSSTQAQMSYRLGVTNKNYTVAKPGTGNKTTALSGIAWTSGYVNPSVVKFEARKDNTSIEYTSTNKQQVDLMSSATVDFGGFVLPNGTYDEIELKIRLEKKGSTPAMQLNGQITTDITTYPIVVEVDEPLELKTEQKNVVITPDYNFTAVTTIDLADMTAGISTTLLLNADLTNGVILISSAKNHSLYKIILDNLGARRHHCEFEHHHH